MLLTTVKCPNKDHQLTHSSKHTKSSVNKTLTRIMSCLVVLTPFSVFAASTDESDDRGLSFDLISSYYYDDNVTRSQSGAIDAYVFSVRPELGLRWGTRNSEFVVSLVNETAKYEGSSEDNYSDNYLNLSADFALSSRHRLSFAAGLADAHQGRGQGFSTGVGNLEAEVDTFTQNDYGVRYRFGRDAAKAQLGFYYNVQDVNFDARFDGVGNDITRDRDRQNNTIGATLTYEIGAKTDLVVDINQTEFDYDVETGFGNTVDLLLVGIAWDATSKTSGSIQVGSQSRDFTSGGSEDTSVWLLSLDWAPQSNSLVRLTSGKSSEASIGIGNSLDVTATSLSWELDWNSRWSSSISYSLEDTDFVGTSTTMDTKVLGFNVDFEYNDMLTARFFYNDADRDSNDLTNQLNYDQTIYGITLSFSWL